jgi:CRISPR-associated protein Cas2
MSRHRRPTLICYDIADPKRLRRVFREMRDVALPVQKSVFVAEMSSAELGQLLARLADYIDPQEDRLQAFLLRDFSKPVTLGRAVALTDIWVA